MPAEFPQVEWSEAVAQACRRLAEIARAEDIGEAFDLTSNWLIPIEARAEARIVAREQGVVAGLPILAIVADVFGADVAFELSVDEGSSVSPKQAVAVARGSARDLLTVERTALNFLGRLSGIASLTRRYVDAAGAQAHIYDTRKTTPGWRLLEKYAVRQGGGFNHRLGLSEAVMLKDNHIAQAADEDLQLSSAIQVVRQQMQAAGKSVPLEVEVDHIDQLPDVVAQRPDIVLLDNMTTEQLSHAVALRDADGPGLVLEASGGVTLETVAAIAATGVDRISVGALTHSAPNFDFGLDWRANL